MNPVPWAWALQDQARSDHRMPLEANVHWLANTCYLHSFTDSEHMYKIQQTTGSEIGATRPVKLEMLQSKEKKTGYGQTTKEHPKYHPHVGSDYSGPKETG